MNSTFAIARWIGIWGLLYALLGCGEDPVPDGNDGRDAAHETKDSAVSKGDGGDRDAAPGDATTPDSGRDAGDSGNDAGDSGRDAGDSGGDADLCADVDCSAQADQCNTASCNPDTGKCERTAKADGTACGDGSATACNAPDACRAGVCDQQLVAAGTGCGDAADTACDRPDSCDGAGECLANREPAGASCGDPADTRCDNPDSCDGAGACQANSEPSGTSCGDPADTACDNPDSCDGAGRCHDHLEPSGTACGDATISECDGADSCDGAGTCASNSALVGTACGDRSNTACSAPDTCNGDGVCRANHAGSGAGCGDQNVACHVDDVCNGMGACLDSGLQAEGTGCGDFRNDECRNPDLCDAAGNCHPNDEPVGTSCGNCPAGAACECRSAQCVDACAAFGEAEYGYLGCARSAAPAPCRDISSTGVALSLAAGASATVDIGFDFTLYGVTRRAVHVYEDGLLSFGDGSAVQSAPECLAAGVLNTTSGPAIAPFWTDFATDGEVYYETRGIAPDRTFTVQWVADHALTGADEPADVRVELAENGQRVRVCYVDTTFGSAADDGALAVAGMMDTAGADALQLSCKAPELPDATITDYYCADGCPFTTTSDFDELQAGDALAAASSDWSAWNNDPTSDAVIVTSPVRSAPNSLRLTANDDLVRPFDAGASGVLVISAMTYAPSDMAGSAWLLVLDTYYPAPGTQHWIASIVLDGTNNVVTDDGGSQPQTAGIQPSAPVALVRDRWVEVRVTIDLGARTYSSAYDGQAVVTGRTWSLGATGSMRGVVNLYGGGDLAGAAYFDDVTIAKLPALPCGNGVVDAGEECDLGAQNSDALGSRCDTTCHTSLVAWLDGSDPNGDGSAPATGTVVASWVDKAGYHDAVQVDPAKQPRYVADGLGAGAMAFDGANDVMVVPLDINATVLSTTTIVAVFQNTPGNTSQIAGVWGHDDYGWDRFMASGGSEAGWNGVSTGSGVAGVPSLLTESVPLVTITTLVNGGISTVHVNGRLGTTFVESRSAPGATSMTIGNIDAPFPVGELQFPFAAHSFDGLIAEFMVFDRALTPAARNHLGRQLATKYALASYCGDGVTGSGEQCDDGVNDGVACSATCTTP
jgi:hypothetical protein